MTRQYDNAKRIQQTTSKNGYPMRIVDGKRFVQVPRLKYDVRDTTGNVVLPKGETGVWICFGAGPSYTVPETGKTIRLNIYRKGHVTVHGWGRVW